MTRQRGTETESDSGRNPSKSSSDDYTIYLPIDGITVSAPWKISCYGDGGALQACDKAALASRFDLSESVIETLSEQLGYCLDVESEANLVAVNRAKAIERAAKKLEEVARLARRVETDINKIVQHMKALSDEFKLQDNDKHVLRSAKAQAQAVMQASVGLEKAIDHVIKTPGAAADMSPLNKNHVWDKRRRYVIETCCYAWQDSGLKLSYTNIPSQYKSERHGGLLIDFIQEIVSLVTEPAEKLSTNTIKKDIDRFKKNQAKPDELSLPPTKG